MDGAEFKAVFLPMQRRLFTLALLLMESRQDAEDIVQEAYIRMWNRRSALAAVDNTSGYALSIVRNLCLDRLRLRKTETLDAGDAIVAEQDDLAVAVERHDSESILRNLLAELPDSQRMILQLRDIDDFSFEDISKATGLSEINVRVTLSRARRTIRERFIKIMDYGCK